MAKKTIGDRLVSILAERGMTQAELARKAGLTRSAISNICNGSDPSLDTLRRIARALSLQMGDIGNGTVAANG